MPIGPDGIATVPPARAPTQKERDDQESQDSGGGGSSFLGSFADGVTDVFGGTSGLLGGLGFQRPDSSALEQDRAGYQAIQNTAGMLAAPVVAPTATAPDWYRPTVATAPTTLGELAQARAAQAGQTFMDLDQANAARAQQTALVGQLQRQASGQGPSVAQEQLRQATGANINQQLAAAKSMHGNARLAALRQAGWQGAAIQQQANSQATALRAAEIAQAQGALGNVLATQRGQDVTGAAQQAALTQQTNLANAGYTQGANLANAQLAQNAGQFDANALNAMNLANTSAYNQAGLNYASQVNAGNQALSLANLNSGVQTNALNTQRQNAYIGSLLGAQGGMSGLDTTIYAGNAGWDKDKRNMVGGLLNNVGGVLGFGSDK